MPTIRIPIWIRSEYVTMDSPPLYVIGGQEAAPVKRADRADSCAFVAASAVGCIIAEENRKSKKKLPRSCSSEAAIP